MSPYDRLDALAVRWRAGDDPALGGTAWLPAAVREGTARTRRLLRTLRGKPALDPGCLVRLHSFSRAWEYGERLCERRPALEARLNEPLGDWAQALMDADRESLARRRELDPFARRLAPRWRDEAARDDRRRLKWWMAPTFLLRKET